MLDYISGQCFNSVPIMYWPLFNARKCHRRARRPIIEYNSSSQSYTIVIGWSGLFSSNSQPTLCYTILVKSQKFWLAASCRLWKNNKWNQMPQIKPEVNNIVCLRQRTCQVSKGSLWSCHKCHFATTRSLQLRLIEDLICFLYNELVAEWMKVILLLRKQILLAWVSSENFTARDMFCKVRYTTVSLQGF
jgi:hypothetical protein